MQSKHCKLIGVYDVDTVLIPMKYSKPGMLRNHHPPRRTSIGPGCPGLGRYTQWSPMDRQVVGVVFFGMVAMVAVVTLPQLLDVVWCSAVVVVVAVVAVVVVVV